MQRTSLLEQLDKEATKRAAVAVDPWQFPLTRLRGRLGADGVERVQTQTIFDLLEIPQQHRGAGAGRRLTKLMAALGWLPVRMRGLNAGGYREKLRGFARDARP